MPEFLYMIRPARPTFPADATPEEGELVGRHFAYLQEKLAEGRVILVGRTQDESPLGLCVFEADDQDAAVAFLQADPAVAAGLFVGEVRPYHVALLRGRD